MSTPLRPPIVINFPSTYEPLPTDMAPSRPRGTWDPTKDPALIKLFMEMAEAPNEQEQVRAGEHPDAGDGRCMCTRCGGTGCEPYACDDESHNDAFVYRRPFEPCTLCPPCPVCRAAGCPAADEVDP